MKRILFFIISLLAIASLFLSGCKCVCKHTNLLQDFVQDSIANNLTKLEAKSLYNDEMGYEFISDIDGRILKFGVSMPVADTYTVTLWDAVSRSKLITENVKVKKGNTWCYEKISPYQILKGKRYMLTVNICGLNNSSADYFYYYLKKKVPPPFSYPFTSNNFQVVEGWYDIGSPPCTPTFPTKPSSPDSTLVGFVDVCFEAYK